MNTQPKGEHMNTQPEALRLADWLDETETDYLEPLDHVAAELRRLHEANQELLEALKGAYEFLWGADTDPIALENKLKAALAKHSKEQA